MFSVLGKKGYKKNLPFFFVPDRTILSRFPIFEFKKNSKQFKEILNYDEDELSTKTEFALRVKSLASQSSDIGPLHQFNCENAYKKVSVNEIEFKFINHKNIINYYDFSLVMIDGVLSHITGNI